MKTVLIMFFILVFNLSSAYAQTYNAYQAKNHIGEFATVCGNIVSTYYAERSKGSPTYLNFERQYPNQVFVGIVWGKSRSNFDNSPEKIFENREVCIKGTIRSFKGTPQIYLRNNSQVKF